MRSIYTAESVTAGHPDKLCDVISDSILDDLQAKDPDARAAVETAVKDHRAWIFGEIATHGPMVDDPEVRQIVRRVYADAGYTAEWNIEPSEIDALVSITQQSPELQVNAELGAAGDQGSMVGYAIDLPWANYLPPEYYLANRITRKLTEDRQSGKLPHLGPDGKAQVTLDVGDGQSEMRLLKIVVSAQHERGKLDLICREVRLMLEEVLDEAKQRGLCHTCTLEDAEILINPGGDFVTGGPIADAGLTGRKTVIDSYGPRVPVGGGAFSGKDGTKVDRSGAYAARQAAKSIVAAGNAGECLLRLDYSIGRAEPLYVALWLDGRWAGKEEKDQLLRAFDFSPGRIIRNYRLNQVHHARQAAGGHFTFEDLPWEQTVDISG